MNVRVRLRDTLISAVLVLGVISVFLWSAGRILGWLAELFSYLFFGV